jgi:hypothetical protein
MMMMMVMMMMIVMMIMMVIMMVMMMVIMVMMMLMMVMVMISQVPFWLGVLTGILCASSFHLRQPDQRKMRMEQK